MAADLHPRQNSGTPTLVAALVESATDSLVEGFDADLAETHTHEAGRLGQRVRRLVQHAYAEGLRDGFVQGCQAQADQETDRAAAA